MWRKKPRGGQAKIREATTTKKEAFMKWQQSIQDEDKGMDKFGKKECNTAVAFAKEET